MAVAGKKYTDQQKEEFFRLLDRGGTVRAAARAVGIHENAGYNWLRKTGLTMARAYASRSSRNPRSRSATWSKL
ncbi:transposase [Rhodococcus qingshengii]|uniref:Transposase n=1 Tax=Rhodococcus baikonurensis TaxID=172041 RepID=A0ABV5XG25_9NOCA